MAQIFGQIESLKRIKNELKAFGINRFNSIKELNDFLYNFQNEKNAIINTQKEILLKEINDLKLTIKEDRDNYEKIKSYTLSEIEVRIDTIKLNIYKLTARVKKSIIHKILYSYRLKKQDELLEYFFSNTASLVSNAARKNQSIIEKDENQLKYLNENHEILINKRSLPEIRKLDNVRKVIEDLYPTIAGAIGESLVVKEIEKLPNDYILINDFKLKFNPPIYKRNTDDRIFSIQIDHLLISRSGIYILETKNWSKKSIESLNLRSPVEQIERANFALFITVNEANISLAEHHWGDKQIPIKNIIVMINEKPDVDFKYVKVKSLKELNKYLTYFEPIFTEKEVDRIAKYLISIQQ